MKILLTGATGYIGKRLLPVLVQSGNELVCAVRDARRFHVPPSLAERIEVIELDLLNEESLQAIPSDVDAAYYLVHSMSSTGDYQEMEATSARNFQRRMDATQVKQVIYLSGIVNEEELSKHLASRKQVEDILGQGRYHLTTLRAGIIIGSGSASFEIIRDLVEKLPVMVAPQWLNTKCQPIGVRDVLECLEKSLGCEATYDQNFDIGGPDVLTYKEMLLGFARVRGLRRYIATVPVMTPRLSSYWLYFVTSTSYNLATSLVNSMKVEVVCRDSQINDILGVQPADYNTSLERAFKKIENNGIVSSWKDAYISSGIDIHIADFIKVPQFGCFIDRRAAEMKNRAAAIDKVWRIGGENGWYYGNWLWQIRGYLDKLVGGIGLRRGRTVPNEINAGDSLDFWRVLYADKERGHLLLYAEMKLPGEAWLEFKVQGDELVQTATFRPLGLWGRLYWYGVLPFHGFIFKGMLKAITGGDPEVLR
jgi:uncharacterized protein YbjT (DUF2867 family)